MNRSRVNPVLMIQAWSMLKKSYDEMVRGTESFTIPSAIQYVTNNFQHYHNQLMRDGQMTIENGVARVLLPAKQSNTVFPDAPRYKLDVDRNVYIHMGNNQWDQIDLHEHLYVHTIQLKQDPATGKFYGPPVIYGNTIGPVEYCLNC